MGRELRRVPLNFDWPLHKVWSGFVNDQGRPCPEANKTCFDGETGGGKWFYRLTRLLLMAGEESMGVSNVEEFDRLHTAYQQRGRLYPHPYLTRLSTAPAFTHGKNDRGEQAARGEAPVFYLVPITKDLGELVEGVSGQKIDRSPLSTNDAVLSGLRTRLLALAGLPECWGVCPVCNGDGVDPACLAAYEAWKPTEPPTGEGFQLWGTTSEGEPHSPVFKTFDELCVWCADNATTFGGNKASATKWKLMLDDGFVYHREGNAIFL